MSASQRTKGAVAEREVIAVLREFGWTGAKRTSDGRGQAARGDVADGPQGLHIEIKRQERLNVPAAFDQALRDAPRGHTPVLVHRPSRHEWMATLPLDALLTYLRRDSWR